MPEAGGDSELRAALLIAYGLFLLALVNGATAIIGVVLAYVKRDAARGTIWESHFRNLIRVFWIGLVAAMLLLAAVLQALGGFVFSLFATNGNPPPQVIAVLVTLLPALYGAVVLFVVWYMYRTLRGLIHVIESRPY